ncbi:interferon regulatory factor 1 isoform X1 [Ascaphus truei]|uniref:interferon regulatory factor 1 isoform X1 n=1 Tax=Ascaphus truei TaxID=8439 RepID=UPI003F5A9133
MPVTRLRLRPWLEKQIGTNTIPGLVWLNKDERIFQIPWKHAARHGWDINRDACLFRSWAIHTGRYKCGEKEPDPKTWKANFRCAMNSLSDIEEVKDKSVYKGSSAIRVYRMLPAQIKTERKVRKSKSHNDCKSMIKKKIEDSSPEEVEEAVENTQLPRDHSSYTATCSMYAEQEIDIGSTDILDINECDVTSTMTEWNCHLEISKADSTNDLYPFQVSPMPSSSEEDEGINVPDDLFNMLEQNSEWQQTNIDGKGYYTNESCTQTSYLTELSTMDQYEETKVSGEIELRFGTDMKPRLDLISWLDPNFTVRSAGLSAISCAL